MIPTLTISNQPVSEISDVNGRNVCSVEFTTDTELEEWEARANGGTGHGIGDLVGGGMEVGANSSASFSILPAELTKGEKIYTVGVWGKGYDGYWSDGTRDQPKAALPLACAGGALFSASDGAVKVKNDGSYGKCFTSAYTGAVIDSFISAVT